jgi:hypothetical protein
MKTCSLIEAGWTDRFAPAFAEVEEGDWGTWTSERYGISMTVRVESYSLDGKWQVGLRLREISADVYNGVLGSHVAESTVNLSAVANAATSATGGLTAGVTLSGFDPSDTVRVSLPTGQTYVAYSVWGTPAYSGFHTGSQNRLSIIPDGVAGDMFEFVTNPPGYGGTFGWDGYETARAAFGVHSFTGASSYTFFIRDDPIGDNSGGLSVRVERFHTSGSTAGSAVDWEQTTPPIDVGAPDSANWSLAAITLTSNGVSAPALELTGDTSDDDYTSAVIVEYWPSDGVIDPTTDPDDPAWIMEGSHAPSTTKVDITSIEGGQDYYVAVRYVVSGFVGDRLVLGPVTAASADVSAAIGDSLVAGSNVTITDNGDGTFTVDAAAAGGGGAMTLISEQVLTADGIPSSFTSIPASYRDLVLVVRGQRNSAVTDTAVLFQFNGDTAGNYDRGITTIVGSTVFQHDQTYGTTNLAAGVLPGTTAPSGASGVATATISDYRGTAFHKHVSVEGAMLKQTSSGGTIKTLCNGRWRNTAAITQIDFVSSMKAGSVVSLYGRS